jgi:hypothetical protein
MAKAVQKNEDPSIGEMVEFGKNIMNVNRFLIDKVAGVDIGEWPVFNMIFPKPAEGINYERIARDVSRIVDQAFTENDMLHSNAHIDAVMREMERYVEEEDKDDSYLKSQIDKLEETMAVLTQQKYRLVGAGYYGPAVQTVVGIYSLRMMQNPEKTQIRSSFHQALDRHIKFLRGAAGELRSIEESKISRNMRMCTRVNANWEFYVDGKTAGVFSNEDQCQNGFFAYIKSRAQGSLFLDNMVEDWKRLRVVTVGQVAGQKIVNVLEDKETPRDLGTRAQYVGLVKDVFYDVVDKSTIKEWGGDVCKVLGSSVEFAKTRRAFPNDPTIKERFLRLAECPAQ